LREQTLGSLYIEIVLRFQEEECLEEGGGDLLFKRIKKGSSEREELDENPRGGEVWGK